MRAFIFVVPAAALLGACEVTENPNNNSSTVTLSGEAAKNGTASALDTASSAVDRAANKVNEVSNNASSVRTGLSNLSASASKLGQSVDHAADSLGNAVDGKHRVEITTDRTVTTTTNATKK
jgi:methyl-accepting chemotaxis protein